MEDNNFGRSPYREREQEKRGGYGGRPREDDDLSGKWDEDRLERLILFTQRTYEKKLTHLYYIIWKLLFHIDNLDRLLKKARGGDQNGEIRRQFGSQDIEEIHGSPGKDLGILNK